jgi:hypothetical protein
MMRIVLRILDWIVTIPYALIIAFFAIGLPYCAVAFVQGGLPRVKSCLIHIQIEGRPIMYWNEANDYWTWPHALRPILILCALGIALWAVRLRLRRSLPHLIVRPDFDSDS